MHHPWDLSPTDAVALQRRLAGKVRAEPLAPDVRLVAGVDCAYLGGGGGRMGIRRADRIVALAVLLDTRTWEVVDTAEAVVPCLFPYVPGLLSFREAPAVIAAVESLPRRPDVLMVDGQGRAHPRRLGIASHVGLWLDLPTLGVAKSRLCGTAREPGPRRGSRTQLRHDGETVGLVVRTRDRVKPLYVSVGHRITLAEAGRWTLRAARGYRLPEPTRQGHLRVTARKRQLADERP